MFSRTVCSTSKDSLFCTYLTDYPSTESFYEVQAQLPQHNFQKWCRNSRMAASWFGRYYPPEGGGINLVCLEEQKPVSRAWVGLFLFIYIALFHSPPFKRPPLTFIKNSVGFSTVLHHIKSRGEIQNRIKTFHLKADFVHCIHMCACVFFFPNRLWDFSLTWTGCAILKLKEYLGK